MAHAFRRETTSDYQSDSAPFGETSILDGAPEVVGVLTNEDELEAVIDELLTSGFDSQQLSILAGWHAAGDDCDRATASVSVASFESGPHAHVSTSASSHARAELVAQGIDVPIYLLGIGRYAAIVASGGSLAFALAALLLTGAAAGDLDGLLAHTIAHHHRAMIAAQITNGGLLLWIQVRTPAQQNKAIQVLNNHRGGHVHVHDLGRDWGIEDVPLRRAQPDVFSRTSPRTQ